MGSHEGGGEGEGGFDLGAKLVLVVGGWVRDELPEDHFAIAVFFAGDEVERVAWEGGKERDEGGVEVSDGALAARGGVDHAEGCALEHEINDERVGKVEEGSVRYGNPKYKT